VLVLAVALPRPSGFVTMGRRGVVACARRTRFQGHRFRSACRRRNGLLSRRVARRGHGPYLSGGAKALMRLLEQMGLKKARNYGAVRKE
jgi:hypothetical protein